MEQLIVQLFKESLVGGAFVYLLYMYITKTNKTAENNTKTLAEISGTLVDVSNTLVDVSNTLNNLDVRVRKLEEEKG